MAFATGYVLEEAREGITLSAIAYQSEDGDYDTIKAAITSALASSTVLDGHLTLVWLGISLDRANLLYVAQDDREASRYALVARGTDWNFLTDWVDDFDVLHTHDWPSANPPNPSILLAQGSWDGLQALLTMTSQFLAVPSQPGAMTLTGLLNQISVGATGGLDLFVTGHSLGGALATILGLYLADTVGNWGGAAASVSLKSYTFASPTTGNQAYADYYNGRLGLANISWQAFRVFNERDMVPFAYADVEGIADSGISFSPILYVEVATMAAIIQTILNEKGVSYVQVGSGNPLSNNPCKTGQPPCPNPATTLDDFACWVGYEHSSQTYASLLGAPAEGLEDHSADLSSITSARQRRLEKRNERLKRAIIEELGLEAHKSNEPNWMELAKISLDEFKNRRELEWKLAFGFWAALAGFTYFFLSNAKVEKPPIVWLGVIYGLIFLISVFCWMCPLQKAHAKNKAYFLYYMKMASSAAVTSREDATNAAFQYWRPSNSQWLGGQIAFTFLGMLLSWELIACR